jgi:tetratricopeptide (TPR) repeat protein
VDLYIDARQYQRAIVRLEEALARFPDDPRIGRVRFQLAESYRLSASGLVEGNAASRPSSSGPYSRDVQSRLRRACQLYDEVIATLEAKDEDDLSELEKTYLKLSCFYRADCIFDEQTNGEGRGVLGYAEAIRLYDLAASKYRTDPIALSAYVQMIQCYLRMGDSVQARTTLERMRWILRGIPDTPEVWRVPGGDKATWSQYLAWLGDSPMFRDIEK